MTRQTRNNPPAGDGGRPEGRREGKRGGRGGDPNQDVQPWLGWVAAALVVLLVVVAVAMGVERANQSDEPGEAEVAMTPLVGGMAVATSAGSGDPQVTPSEVITVTMVDESATMTGTVPDTITDTVAMTSTAGMTETATLMDGESLTETATVTTTEAVTETVTEAMTETGAVTTTAAVTTTDELTATGELTGTAEPTATPEPTVTPTRPAPTPSPTPTPVRVEDLPVFAPGTQVAGATERVSLHAEASVDALVLDTYGAGVELEVLEPAGDALEYPVVADNHGWVRVRANDGLVGWAMTDDLSAVE